MVLLLVLGDRRDDEVNEDCWWIGIVMVDEDWYWD